jgi:hypothetical protein
MTWTQLSVIGLALIQIGTGIYKGDATLIGSAVLTVVALWTHSPKPNVDGHA